MVPRRLTAVLAILAFAVALATVLARGSTSSSGTPSVQGLQHLAALEGGGRGENEESGGAAAEAYTDRAFPAEGVSIDQIQGAIAANAAVKSRGASGVAPKWDFLG